MRNLLKNILKNVNNDKRDKDTLFLSCEKTFKYDFYNDTFITNEYYKI